MEFHSRDAIGKAGERLLETYVEEELNFVYRKVGPPDIGIDGEIEILRADRSSTGGLLKVQVKTTSVDLEDTSQRVPFDEKHLDYFDSLAVQPILVLVSLPKKKLWWKPILHKENYVGPRSGFGVTFDLQRDLLNKSSMDYLRLLGDRSNAMIAQALLEEVERVLTDMQDRENSENFDYTTAHSWAQTVAVLTKNIEDARCLLRYERRNTEETNSANFLLSDVKVMLAKRRSFFTKHEVEDLLIDDSRDYW